MEKILKNPNLPSKLVKKVIISENNPETEKALNKLGIETVKTVYRTNVQEGNLKHSDLHFCQLDSETVILSNSQSKIGDMIKNNAFCDNVIIEEKTIRNSYPDDVLLNCVFFGSYVIYNPQTVSKHISDYIKHSNLEKIEVSQGYTKCSLSIVADNAILTDDLVISKKVIERGIDCLLLEKGAVKLKGYDYGFIGGATGKISNDMLAFNGNYKSYKNFLDIEKFLQKHGVKPVILKDGELEDIGSIIPFTEVY